MIQIEKLKNLSHQNLKEKLVSLGKDPSFVNRRIVQELVKNENCPHKKEDLKRAFGFEQEMDKLTDEYIENLKPIQL